MTRITLGVNGRQVQADVEPRTSLADFLRGHENLTGTHLGCEHGVCGACTVLLNGVPARSCIAFAVAQDGAEVRTVEGFEDDAVMAKLRETFHLEHALQCGYCTPGMLVTARDIVARFADADEKRIRIELAGNLCRCTGYQGIVNAIQRAMRELPAESRVAQAQAPVAVPAAPPFRTFTARTAAPRQAAAAAPVAGPEAEKGWSRIVDRFTVALPPAQVWNAFANVPRVARCLPGAEFEAKDERNLEGELRFAFGPIKAAFACTATVERDEATRTGILRGSGSDRRGQSRAKGQVSYRLFEEAGGAATRVEVTFDYQLQGALAQFSRPGLVKDFVSHLIAEFARNLSAMTGGGAAAEHAPRASLGLGDLLAILFARLKRWLGF